MDKHEKIEAHLRERAREQARTRSRAVHVFLAVVLLAGAVAQVALALALDSDDIGLGTFMPVGLAAFVVAAVVSRALAPIWVALSGGAGHVADRLREDVRYAEHTELTHAIVAATIAGGPKRMVAALTIPTIPLVFSVLFGLAISANRAWGEPVERVSCRLTSQKKEEKSSAFLTRVTCTHGTESRQGSGHIRWVAAPTFNGRIRRGFFGVWLLEKSSIPGADEPQVD